MTAPRTLPVPLREQNTQLQQRVVTKEAEIDHLREQGRWSTFKKLASAVGACRRGGHCRCAHKRRKREQRRYRTLVALCWVITVPSEAGEPVAAVAALAGSCHRRGARVGCSGEVPRQACAMHAATDGPLEIVRAREVNVVPSVPGWGCPSRILRLTLIPPIRILQIGGLISMSASSQNIITKRAFDFSKLQSAQTQEVPLCRALDVLGAKQLELVIRVHSKTITSTGQIDVIVQAISLSGEDPSIDFLYTSSGAGGVVTLGSTSLTSTLTAPYSVLVPITAPWGPMIRVILKGTGASSATIQASLSIDLIVYDN